jgi:hypothetical protein
MESFEKVAQLLRDPRKVHLAIRCTPDNEIILQITGSGETSLSDHILFVRKCPCVKVLESGCKPLHCRHVEGACYRIQGY